MSDNGVYRYTPQVQLKILALLWRDEKSHTIYSDVIKPRYFSSAVHIDLCRIIADYYDRYSCSPTYDALVEQVHEMCSRSKAKSKIEDEYTGAIQSMADASLHDIEFIRDKVMSFGKRQALVDAVLESADILEKRPDTEYGKIQGLVKDAMLVGEDSQDLGQDIFSGIEDRIISYTLDDDVIERVPTGMDMLDVCLGGGVGRTEMCVVIAPPGRGKTSALISMGAAAVEAGYSVLHVSLENNEKQILRNYDLRLLHHNMEYLQDNVDASIDAMFNIKKYMGGQLRVKKYPTKTLTVEGLRTYLDQLKVVDEFVPDVLVVDYGMIMKPAYNYTDKRNGIESVYEDLRAVADDYNCALYTAAQGNRSSLSKKIVTTADIAECFAIANIADIAIALCQTAKEKQQGVMRGFLAKVRDSPDGLLLSGRIDYETKQLSFDEIVDIGSEDDTEDEDWGD